MHPTLPGSPIPGRVPPPAGQRERDGFVGAGVVLLVTAVATAFLSALPDALTDVSASDGTGEGDLGVLKLYVSSQVANAFLTLALVLLVAAVTCFVVALVRRLRRP